MTRVGRTSSILGLILAGLAIGFGLSEAVVRFTKPLPAVQIIAAQRDMDFWVDNGVPLWRMPSHRGQSNEACPRLHPAAARIEIYGPSIFFGSGVEDGELTFSERLQKRLDAAAPGAFCVMNFAQPGFHYDQNAALARDLIPRYRPVLVFWAIWDSDPFHFRMLGNRAYSFDGLIPVGVDGYPRVFPLPASLNRALFRNSRLFEYTTLKLLRLRNQGIDASPIFKHFAQYDLPRIVQLSRRENGTLVPVFCPRLDRPFSEWSSAPGFQPLVSEVEKMVRRERIPEIRLGDLLADQDYRRLRSDSYCHYNAEGQEVLAEVFFRWIKAHPALLKRPRQGGG